MLKEYPFTIVTIVILTAVNLICAVAFSSKGDITLPFLLSVGVTVIGAVTSYYIFDKPMLEKKD